MTITKHPDHDLAMAQSTHSCGGCGCQLVLWTARDKDGTPTDSAWIDRDSSRLCSGASGAPHLPVSTNDEQAELEAIKNDHRGGPRVLTWEQVEQVRARYLTGEITMQALADEYGTDKGTISRIISRQTRKYR